MADIRAELLSLQDAEYRDFMARLLPTVDKGAILGVRTPALRALAKRLAGTPEAKEFLAHLPHALYEENCLHAFLIEHIRDYDLCIAALNGFLPYIDNWATCDSLSPKCVKRHLEAFLPQVRAWIFSEPPYTCRFGLGMLMRWYLGDAFRPEFLDWAASLRSDEYYVNMMVAWFFATALAKQYPAALPYLRDRRLSPWVHKKAIQKAIESCRLTDAQKAELRAMR